ncbi:hypothetical protein EVAR_22124_1 [Eumeta japonica]|uniref:Uncharacterized protein n=1 Tax=Eumeta variegata TaxID=151549 RepID=A0A4C1W062_EUMVA|nr:hypothetical protein EVAR_22124_1 [Eumeta japonica]
MDYNANRLHKREPRHSAAAIVICSRHRKPFTITISRSNLLSTSDHLDEPRSYFTSKNYKREKGTQWRNSRRDDNFLARRGRRRFVTLTMTNDTYSLKTVGQVTRPGRPPPPQVTAVTELCDALRREIRRRSYDRWPRLG